MPAKIVDVPGVGQVEFPDSMGDDQIAAAIRQQLAPQIPGMEKLGGTAPPPPKPPTIPDPNQKQMDWARQAPVSAPMRNSAGVIKPAPDVAPGAIARTATAPLRVLSGGAEQLGKGMTRVAKPENVSDFAGGVSDIARGAGTLALPVALPAIVAAPLASALAFGGGTLASKGVEAGADALGVPEGFRDLLGTTAGVAGGAVGARIPGAVSRAVRSVDTPQVRSAVRDAGGAAVGMGKTFLHEIPGVKTTIGGINFANKLGRVYDALRSSREEPVQFDFEKAGGRELPAPPAPPLNRDARRALSAPPANRTPVWERMPQEQPVTAAPRPTPPPPQAAPPEVPPWIARARANIAARQAQPPPEPRVPIWQQEAPVPNQPPAAPPPQVEPSAPPGVMPSGRAVPGAEPRLARPQPPEVGQPIEQGIARVQEIAARQPEPPPTIVDPAPSLTATPEAPATAAPVSRETPVPPSKAELAAAAGLPEHATPAEISQALLRSMEESGNAPPPAEAPAPPVGEHPNVAVNRGAKVKSIADAMKAQGITHQQLSEFPPETIRAVVDRLTGARGDTPLSETSMAQLMEQMKPEPNVLQKAVAENKVAVKARTAKLKKTAPSEPEPPEAQAIAARVAEKQANPLPWAKAVGEHGDAVAKFEKLLNSEGADPTALQSAAAEVDRLASPVAEGAKWGSFSAEEIAADQGKTVTGQSIPAKPPYQALKETPDWFKEFHKRDPPPPPENPLRKAVGAEKAASRARAAKLKPAARIP